MKIDDLIFEMAMTGLEGDKSKFRNLAIAAAQAIKKGSPHKSHQLAEAISQTTIGKSPFRALGHEEVPSDGDSDLDILNRVEFPSTDDPLFDKSVSGRVDDFITEYLSGSRLLQVGIKPPTSLILTGRPGVGKTMLAHYIANKTGKKLYILNLATVVSSYLGKTSQNLKAALDFAKEHDAIIFLDEFDSIAKRRDDSTDLGELKRIVNVLLLELENWPPNSLIIAATNHPELIDVAIWRRFDLSIEIPLPSTDVIRSLLMKDCPEIRRFPDLITLYAGIFTGSSPADIRRTLNKAKRQSVVKKIDLYDALLLSARDITHALDKKSKKALCGAMRDIDPKITLDKIGEMVDLSPSTVCYHLKNQTTKDKDL